MMMTGMMMMMMTMVYQVGASGPCHPCVCVADRVVCHSQPPAWQTLPRRGVIRHLDARGVPVERLDLTNLRKFLPNLTSVDVRGSGACLSLEMLNLKVMDDCPTTTTTVTTPIPSLSRKPPRLPKAWLINTTEGKKIYL